MLFSIASLILVLDLAVTTACGNPCPAITGHENIQAVLHPINVGTVLVVPLFLVNAKLVRSEVDYRGTEETISWFNMPKKNSFVKNKAKEKAIRRAHFKSLVRYFLVNSAG
jgi:hypothetical protein